MYDDVRMILSKEFSRLQHRFPKDR